MAKTGVGLVAYANAQLGNPYWYGTYGNTADQKLLDYKKTQYPNEYRNHDFTKDFGKRVHDCVGLIKGYLWSDTPTSEPVYGTTLDVNAAALYQNCRQTGFVSDLPEILGICLFTKNFDHVGVYIGNGYSIEARGKDFGVVRTKNVARNWCYWGMPKWISYYETEEIPPYDKLDFKRRTFVNTLPLTKLGHNGLYVILARWFLASRDVVVDTRNEAFDKELDTVVRLWQKSHNLEVDGEIGRQTWSTLIP